MGEPARIPASLFLPGPARALDVVGIWGVSWQVEDLSLALCLSNELNNFKNCPYQGESAHEEQCRGL